MYSPWGEPTKPASTATAQLAEDVVALADTLGIKTFAFVGFAAAARVGLHLGKQHPSRLSRLVLVSPSPADGAPAPMHGFGDAVWGTIAAGKAKDLVALMSVIWDNAHYIDPVQLEDVFTDFAHAHEKHVKGTFTDVCKPLPAGTLEGITVPTLMVAGDRDAVFRFAIADGARIPGSALHIFYRSNHMLYMERPAEFAALVQDFVGHSVSVPAAAQA
jgi:pimeloyl-ACP methyl ester carboxylesterase